MSRVISYVALAVECHLQNRQGEDSLQFQLRCYSPVYSCMSLCGNGRRVCLLYTPTMQVYSRVPSVVPTRVNVEVPRSVPTADFDVNMTGTRSWACVARVDNRPGQLNPHKHDTPNLHVSEAKRRRVCPNVN